MPVYTLNPSHRRAAAKRTPSLRERVAARRNPGTAYNIYLDGKLIDVMPYYPHLAHLTLDEMRRKLVSDGYDPRITVKTRKERSKPAARRNPLSEDGVVVSNPATAYNVYLGTKLIDTVFQSGKSDADEVRRSLINHDGYDHRIRVVKASRKNPLSEDGVVVSNPATAYNVYFGAKKVDTLYLTGEPSAEKVRARLIEDAGLDPRIRVRKAGAVSDTHGKRLGYEGLSAHVRRDEVPLAQRPARRRKPLATGAQRASTLGIKVSRDSMNYGKGDKRTKQTFETAFGTYASDWKAKNVTRLHVEGAGKSRWHDSVPEALRDIEARLRGGGSVEVVWYGGGGASVIDTITALSARRKNPLSEDGVVVSNPKKRKVTKKKAGGRTEAQKNAAKAMRLWHSGKASSLAEAWEMVRAGR